MWGMWSGRSRSKRQKVDDRHDRGVHIAEADVVPVGPAEWRVSSQQPGGAGSRYQVHKLADACPARSCRDSDKCYSQWCAGLCAHMYSCTCPDEFDLCKHVHRVRSLQVRAAMTPAELQAALRSDEARRRAQELQAKVRRAQYSLDELSQFVLSDRDVLEGVIDEVVDKLGELAATCASHAEEHEGRLYGGGEDDEDDDDEDDEDEDDDDDDDE